MRLVTVVEQEAKIPDEILARWQRVVDVAARLFEVQASLVMKRDPPDHRVFVTSSNSENPYQLDAAFTLNTGLYCDAVMRDRSMLLVPDARADEEWNSNPDLEYGLTYYQGLPLQWPDGTMFGTICVLDGKNNQMASSLSDLLYEFKGIVESDLQLLVEMAQRKKIQSDLQKARDELEHRISGRTKELASANEDLREANTAMKILLRHMEESKVELESKISNNINELVLPHIRKLKRYVSDTKAHTHLNRIEVNLTEITDPFVNQLSHKFAKLTPTELEIAKLILQGESTKTIAEIRNTATSTVDFHRYNIRKKIGIHTSNVNLRSYLISLN